jgi:hypothetical protein
MVWLWADGNATGINIKTRYQSSCFTALPEKRKTLLGRAAGRREHLQR